MNFAYPNILFFLLLLIIPIIIHLFHLKRYKKVYFSSISFIKKIEKETSSTKKIKKYLILACRLLAFASLILAFAQPYRPNSTSETSLKTIVPIYLDNSFSMSAKGSNGNLLNQAKTSIRKIVEEYPLEQNYMLVTNEMAGHQFRLITRSELEDIVAETEFSSISREVIYPIESIHGYLNSINYTGNSQYYIISDFQQNSLKLQKGKIDTAAFYSFLQIQPQTKDNLYIDSVWFEQPFRRVNTNNTLNISIQNTGRALTNIELELNIGEINRKILTDLKKEGKTIVQINYTDRTPGAKSGSVSVVDPNIHFDNQYYFSYTIDEQIKVHIINGEQATNYPELVFKGDDFYDVSSSSIHQLRNDEMNNVQLVILNEVKEINSGLLTQLKQLIDKGISLLIIPSPSLDINSYNYLLNAVYLPIYTNKAQQEIRLGKLHHSQSFFDGMFDEKIEKLNLPPLKQYFSSSIPTKANFSNLIDYENGQPMLVKGERYFNVFCFYTAIHHDFNDFGRSALFSSLLLRIGEISQGSTPLALTIGVSNSFQLKNQEANESAYILKHNDFEFIPEIKQENAGATSITFDKTSDFQISDGIYRIELKDQLIGQLALNYNRNESTMQFATQEELNNWIQKLEIKNYNNQRIEKLNDIQKLPVTKTKEYWKFLVILALIFFLLEMIIIKFVKI